jgi:hypothetical protein
LRVSVSSHDFAQGFEAIHVGHFEIENDGIGKKGICLGDGLGTIFGFTNIVTALTDRTSESLAEGCVIVG